MKKTLHLNEQEMKGLVRKLVMETIKIHESYADDLAGGLASFIEKRHDEYQGKPEWMWDEGVVNAVLDYYGSMGEFSEEDMKTLEEYFPGEVEKILDMCHEGEEDSEEKYVPPTDDWEPLMESIHKTLLKYKK